MPLSKAVNISKIIRLSALNTTQYRHAYAMYSQQEAAGEVISSQNVKPTEGYLAINSKLLAQVVS